jgi:REP element-mobilizing transposase RayT
MSTFTQILYHIVFSTKYRERTLTSDNRSRLFRYIWGVIEKKQSHPYFINGIEDHLHIATHIHPTVALAPLIKDIKLASSSFIGAERIFSNFGGWQDGYAAFTCSYRDKDRLIEYIKNQEAHHKKLTFKEELTELLKEHGIEFDEKYLL